MSIQSVRVVEQLKHSTVVQAEACQSCGACPVGQSKLVEVPLVYSGGQEDQLALQIDIRDQLFAVTNSLLLPVFLALIFAFIADSVHSNEIYGIVSAVCGFTIGMLLCRQLRTAAVTAKRV